MKNLLLAKVKAVLEAVAAADEPVTLRELSERLDIPVPTLGRIAADLIEMGMLEKTDYHRFAPAPGLIRLGEAARRRTPLLRAAEPLISAHAANLGMNALFAGIRDGEIYRLCFCGHADNGPGPVWRTGLGVMLLAAAKTPKSEALRLFEAANPGCSGADRLIFEREFDDAGQHGTLLKINTMRQWSLSQPLVCSGNVCALCFYGHAPDDCTPERFSFDCSRLISRIHSALADLIER